MAQVGLGVGCGGAAWVAWAGVCGLGGGWTGLGWAGREFEWTEANGMGFVGWVGQPEFIMLGVRLG